MDFETTFKLGCITRIHNDLKHCVEHNHSDEITHGLWWAVFLKWSEAFDLIYPHTSQSGRHLVFATLCMRLTSNTRSIVFNNPVWLKMFDRFYADHNPHEVVHVLRRSWPHSETADFLEHYANIQQKSLLTNTIGSGFNTELRKI